VKKIVIALCVIGALVYYAKGFVQSGQLERYLDTYANPAMNAKIEYYWGMLLEFANHDRSALYRLERVTKKYADLPEGSDAWAAYIQLLDSTGSRAAALQQAQLFLEKFPNHAKAEVIRKKISFYTHGM
jgi:hypothetical protein